MSTAAKIRQEAEALERRALRAEDELAALKAARANPPFTPDQASEICANLYDVLVGRTSTVGRVWRFAAGTPATLSRSYSEMAAMASHSWKQIEVRW